MRAPRAQAPRLLRDVVKRGAILFGYFLKKSKVLQTNTPNHEQSPADDRNNVSLPRWQPLSFCIQNNRGVLSSGPLLLYSRNGGNTADTRIEGCDEHRCCRRYEV